MSLHLTVEKTGNKESTEADLKKVTKADSDGALKERLEEIAEALPPTDPYEAAETAGLYYVEEDEPGYTRKRQGRGFTYLDWKGRRVTDARLRKRFEALVIPPAWKNVWICRKRNGHIQATGRDAKGRKQYIYHPEWDALRNLTKFSRMILFGDALPGIRVRVAADLRRHKLDREKVLALVVRLLEETMIRIGNQEYARKNSSYGLTTFLDDHASIHGSHLTFAFVGKSGKEHEIDVHSRRLANLVRRCQDLPGQRLFQYLDENGECCQVVSSSDVNDYLREITGMDFSAKDFRTWGGTVLAATELDALGPVENEKQADKQIVQAVKHVAEALGNTPATCRKYYIHPGILDAYRDGSLFTVMAASREMAVSASAEREKGGVNEEEQDLSVEERAVIRLLKQRLAAGLDQFA